MQYNKSFGSMRRSHRLRLHAVFLGFSLLLVVGFRLTFLLVNSSFCQGTRATVKSVSQSRLKDETSSDRVEHSILRCSNATMRKLPSNKIFMTGPWVPDHLLEPDSLQDPDMEVHFFNNTAMALSVKFIDVELREEAGLKGAWEAWASLRPWAFRADLWRYMILWSEGGIYLDSKIRIIAPLITWAGLLAEEELSVCSDGDLEYMSTKFPDELPIMGLWNAAMSARRRSPVLLEAIRTSISNVLSRAYVLPYFDATDLGDHEDLSVTGPTLLGYAARLGLHKGTVHVPCALREGWLGITTESNIIVFEKDLNEHTKVRDAGNIYGELYKQKRLYCDAAPPSLPDAPCDLEALVNATQVQV